MGLATVGWVFNLHHEVPTSAPKLIAIAVIFPCFALLCVIVRFYLRLRAKSSTSIGIDDVVVTIAWLFCIFYSIIIIYQTRWGQGLNTAYFPPENTTPFGKVQYVSGPVYPLCLMGFKVSILTLYLRVVRGVRKHRRIIYTVIVVVCLTQLAYVFLFSFQCIPVQKIWDQSISGKCINEMAFLYSLAAMSMLLDIVILLLPVPVLLQLQMSLRKRTGLCCILALGLFITVIQILRILRVRNLKSYTNSAALIEWSIIEINLGIAIACIPTFGPIIHRVFGDVRSSIDSVSAKMSRNPYTVKIAPIRLGSSSGDIAHEMAGSGAKTITEAHRVNSSDSHRAIITHPDGVLTTRSYTVDVERRDLRADGAEAAGFGLIRHGSKRTAY